jgi:pyocin large subunit-like protein
MGSTTKMEENNVRKNNNTSSSSRNGNEETTIFPKINNVIKSNIEDSTYRSSCSSTIPKEHSDGSTSKFIKKAVTTSTTVPPQTHSSKALTCKNSTSLTNLIMPHSHTQ